MTPTGAAGGSGFDAVHAVGYLYAAAVVLLLFVILTFSILQLIEPYLKKTVAWATRTARKRPPGV